MPFDEKKEYTPKQTLKQMPGQKSMFDNKPRPPTQQEFQQQVQESQDQVAGYKKRAAELFMQFNKLMADKTIPRNKNVFNMETEKELIGNMVKLAQAMNRDPNEQEGDGTLTWVIALLTTTLRQRDRINELEYSLSSLQKKLESTAFTDYINKEINKALDKRKSNE